MPSRCRSTIPEATPGLCVSIANRPIDDTFERNALQMVSLFTYQRCRELGGQSLTSFAPRLLTPPRGRLHAMGAQG
jgi:hypothetical protein